MPTIDNLWQKFKGNGKVYNYTRKWIWVVETTTNHPTGPAIAHKLAPRTKAPINSILMDSKESMAKLSKVILVGGKSGVTVLRTYTIAAMGFALMLS